MYGPPPPVTPLALPVQTAGRTSVSGYSITKQLGDTHIHNAMASAVASSSSGALVKQPLQIRQKAVVDSDASSSSIVSVVVITKFSINMRRQEIPPPG